MKKIVLSLFFVFSFFIFQFNFSLAQEEEITSKNYACGTGEGYRLLEGIPFVAEAGKCITFPSYISKVYIFAISAIAIASLLMMTIGGGYYLLSAGNTSVAGTGKALIKDALVGLIVAFLSYLLLYTINPDILSGKLDTSKMKAPEFKTSSTGDTK